MSSTADHTPTTRPRRIAAVTLTGLLALAGVACTGATQADETAAAAPSIAHDPLLVRFAHQPAATTGDPLVVRFGASR